MRGIYPEAPERKLVSEVNSLKSLFEKRLYQSPKPKKKQDRGRIVYFIYKHLLHGNESWIVRESRSTLAIYKPGFAHYFAATNSNFGKYMKEGEELGLWKILTMERGYMRIELPLVKAWYPEV